MDAQMSRNLRCARDDTARGPFRDGSTGPRRKGSRVCAGQVVIRWRADPSGGPSPDAGVHLEGDRHRFVGHDFHGPGGPATGSGRQGREPVCARRQVQREDPVATGLRRRDDLPVEGCRRDLADPGTIRTRRPCDDDGDRGPERTVPRTVPTGRSTVVGDRPSMRRSRARALARARARAPRTRSRRSV